MAEQHLMEINCETIRNIPFKGRILKQYHNWLKKQRLKDKNQVSNEWLNLRRKIDPEFDEKYKAQRGYKK